MNKLIERYNNWNNDKYTKWIYLLASWAPVILGYMNWLSLKKFLESMSDFYFLSEEEILSKIRGINNLFYLFVFIIIALTLLLILDIKAQSNDKNKVFKYLSCFGLIILLWGLLPMVSSLKSLMDEFGMYFSMDLMDFSPSIIFNQLGRLISGIGIACISGIYWIISLLTKSQ